MMIKNKNHTKQATAIQSDIHVMTNAANEIIEAFGEDSEIGKSYARLAEAANGANEALAILKLHMARRLAGKIS